MARYIDADVLIRELTSIKSTFGSGSGMIEGGLGVAISTVNNIPTADVAPVVRCKDCKYWTKVKDITDQDGNPVYDCPKWPEDFYWADEDGFCSGGVKRSADVSTADVISRELYKQVCWERDEAIKALEAHGLSLGQK